ncbi:DUF4128 domain-containing protein [Pseudomonas cichorii]|nr:phage tail terminator-like protein [Pseudomonas cichorii]MBX8534534.1 DUF4128 domain-containing protein [Pseudomonas cichorii]
MSHKAVRAMLEMRLSDWAAARIPVLRIAYQAVAFEPQAGETYLSAFLLPSGADSVTLEGVDRVFAGVFQVSVVAPVGQGTGAAEGIAGELEDLFPSNLRLSHDGINMITLSPVEVGPPVISGTVLSVPTSFRYHADTL